MRRRAPVPGLLALAAALAAPALAQPSAVSRAKIPASSEAFRVVPGTRLADVLAKPDATKVVLPDGKQTTVGEIRKGVAAREQHFAALKTSPAALQGKLVVRRGKGAAALQSLAATLAAEDSAAKAARRPGPVAKGPGVLAAISQKNFEGILQVNRRERGWHVTPGGFLTVDGQGFGNTIGEVKIFGQFPGGPLALNPVDWRSDQIYAQLPLGVRGVLDQDVQLQVVTAARKTHRLDGGRFIATRGPEFVVTTGIRRLVKQRSGSVWNAAMGDTGRVDRLQGGHDIDCPKPSRDYLETLDPGRGFVVTGLDAHFGRTDSGDGDQRGDAGSRTFFPGYSFGAWNGDQISINWGVWRSHSSPTLGGLSDGYDWCESNYQLEVSLQGPLGVPF